jgi:hypothetical protein
MPPDPHGIPASPQISASAGLATLRAFVMCEVSLLFHHRRNFYLQMMKVREHAATEEAFASEESNLNSRSLGVWLFYQEKYP